MSFRKIGGSMIPKALTLMVGSLPAVPVWVAFRQLQSTRSRASLGGGGGRCSTAASNGLVTEAIGERDAIRRYLFPGNDTVRYRAVSAVEPAWLPAVVPDPAARQQDRAEHVARSDPGRAGLCRRRSAARRQKHDRRPQGLDPPHLSLLRRPALCGRGVARRGQAPR